ncbi:MAG: ISKra4 family transposase [Cyanothece sp. SIO1E1]|nr:ISKra4 family transposase [Cyanothece sp. SIO1E1]
MPAAIVSSDAHSVTIQVTIPFGHSMLASEDEIQSGLNLAGQLATSKALEQFDSDGSPIERGGQRWTSKGREPKVYQSPYGEIQVERHLYQTAQGGETFCPLEVEARMIRTATPRFAQQISHKYAEMSSVRVVEDLRANHGRGVARSFVQNLAETVGTIAIAKEESWHYQTPPVSAPVATVSFGLDGTCVVMCEEGSRQAMVGTLSLYDSDGKRLHTTYLAAAPEHGRALFLERMQREVEHVCQLYPHAHRQGLADGAPENWEFLNAYTQTQVLDFYHASGYLERAAKVFYPRSRQQQQVWAKQQAHRLKHELGAAQSLLAEFEAVELASLSAQRQTEFQAIITYFRNHHHQMNYAQTRTAHRPIGSGVTEAACKVIVKQRLRGSGMQWKGIGAGIVLSLRTLTYTIGRWQQFWAKINQYGFSF